MKTSAICEREDYQGAETAITRCFVGQTPGVHGRVHTNTAEACSRCSTIGRLPQGLQEASASYLNEFEWPFNNR